MRTALQDVSEALKDIKECYPVQLAEHAIAKGIDKEPAFTWWIPRVIRKKSRIISKVKSKYWRTSHKFGIRIPKTVDEALTIDRDNNNTYWYQAIQKEMKNVRVAFDIWDGTIDEAKSGKKLAPPM